MIGQDEAVKAVADAVRRSRAGLADPNRPNGSFMFLGPTGVGKTELCKALAAVLFDTDDAMVRIDMSEFMEKHSVARMIGAPPGYVGYEEGGFLTEAVRRRPYCLVLLDEIEKAHPDVFNVLLQVLDDGRLTDGHGRTVDFRNTVLVMTSNLGSEAIQTLTESGRYDAIKPTVLGVVAKHFRPEFLNRIDDVVVFHPLGREHMTAIAEIQLGALRARLKEQELGLELTSAAIQRLTEQGYDPVYGARPLKRAIQRSIENPLAAELLSGRFHPGDSIRVRRRRGRVYVSNASPPRELLYKYPVVVYYVSRDKWNSIVTQKSLSLFETALFEKAPLETMRLERTESEAVRAAPSRSDGASPRERQQRHLIAARRLSRRMARLPDHSPEQLQTGRMICRHLVAMLKEADAESETTAH